MQADSTTGRGATPRRVTASEIDKAEESMFEAGPRHVVSECRGLEDAIPNSCHRTDWTTPRTLDHAHTHTKRKGLDVATRAARQFQ